VLSIDKGEYRQTVGCRIDYHVQLQLDNTSIRLVISSLVIMPESQILAQGIALHITIVVLDRADETTGGLIACVTTSSISWCS